MEDHTATFCKEEVLFNTDTLITCTVTSAVHARFQCMKSALVKPQNACMSDSECGQVGLNAFRFHVLQVSNAMHVLQ